MAGGLMAYLAVDAAKVDPDYRTNWLNLYNIFLDAGKVLSEASNSGVGNA